MIETLICIHIGISVAQMTALFYISAKMGIINDISHHILNGVNEIIRRHTK